MSAFNYELFYRRSSLAILLGLIFLSFFGTLAVSAWLFPQSYDWRYRVISNLLSPRDNPEHYWLAAAGVALTGLLMLPFAGVLFSRLRAAAPRGARLSAGAFLAGTIALICACFVVPQHTHPALGICRLHEFIARSSAGFLAVGMLGACWCAWKGRRIFAAKLLVAWLPVTLLPLSGVLCSESLLLVTRLNPSWTTPIRTALRHSMFWHLGFWEWMGAAAVYAFLCAAVFLTPADVTSESQKSFRRVHAEGTL